MLRALALYAGAPRAGALRAGALRQSVPSACVLRWRSTLAPYAGAHLPNGLELLLVHGEQRRMHAVE